MFGLVVVPAPVLPPAVHEIKHYATEVSQTVFNGSEHSTLR